MELNAEWAKRHYAGQGLRLPKYALLSSMQIDIWEVWG